MALQKDHDIADLLLRLPGLGDLGNAFFRDAPDFCQPLNFIFNDVQCFLTELVNYTPGHDRPQALDQAGSQIFPDSVDRRRNFGLKLDDLELFAKFWMIGPMTLHFQNFAGCRCH